MESNKSLLFINIRSIKMGGGGESFDTWAQDSRRYIQNNCKYQINTFKKIFSKLFVLFYISSLLFSLYAGLGLRLNYLLLTLQNSGVNITFSAVHGETHKN